MMDYQELLQALGENAGRSIADELDTHDIPAHMRESLLRYVVEGRMVGDFLTAVLSNDLMRAVQFADAVNRERIAGYARFLYNCVPAGAYGSTERVAVWRREGGLLGTLSAEKAGTR